MSITTDDVRYIARLARLAFTPDEEQRLARDMNEILEYVAQLDELDTTAIEPMAHVLDLHDVVRPDDIHARISRDDALRNAPDHDGTSFRVPKVIG